MRTFWKVVIAGNLLLIALAVPLVFGGASPNLEASTVLVKTPGGHGSGVYIGEGRIITATHVTIDAGPEGKVEIYNNRGGSAPAHVVWQDENTDVSLVKLDVADSLPKADLSCGTPDPAVGSQIEVVGNPLDLVNVHTFGRVATDVAPRGGRPSAFVADVTTGPGNSGGPVFDAEGKVAGFVDELPYGVIPAGHNSFMAVFEFTIVVPRSTICQQLAATQHTQPLAKALNN